MITEVKERTVSLIENHCETGFFTMKFHPSDHLYEDFDTFGSVRFLDAPVQKYSNVFPKRAYRRKSMTRSSTMRITSHGRFNGWVCRGKRYKVSRIESCVKTTGMQELGEVGCVLAKDGVDTNSEELLRNNMSWYDKKDESGMVW